MESKNILLVVICVCAFLVIVFGIALWITLPKNGKTTGSNNISNEYTDYSYLDSMKNNGEIPGIVLKDKTDNSTNESSLVVGEKKDGEASPSETPQPAIALKQKYGSDETQTKSDIVTLRIPLADKTQNTQKYVEEKKKVEQLERKLQPTSVPQKSKIRSLEYWIQAGSYKSKSLAEAQSAKLTDHGFSSQLITREVGGTLYYRVRIGPYTNNAEAQKFLSWIKVIDGMEESYISQLQAQRSVN